MADNFVADPGAGGVEFAGDDIAGIMHPRAKVGFGVAGAYVDASAIDPLPVTLSATGPAVTAINTTNARLGDLPDAAASADTGTWSLNALIKRGLQGITSLNTKLPSQGQALMAASQPVVIASNQSAVPIIESATVITGQAAQTAIINNILPATAGAAGTPIADLRAASVQVVSTGTAGTFIFEQSNDDVNYIALPVFNSALTTAVPITAAITATASAIVYTIPLRCRFLRLRIVSTITGGSIQAFSRLSSEPWTPTVQAVAQPTAASLQATVSGTVTANIGTGALAAGANAIGDVGIQYRANATGAASALNIVSAATTNATIVKASAGRFLGFSLTNNATAVRYVKLHNQATAPTAGAGVVQTYGIPPNGGTITLSVPGGVALTTGIGLTIVTGSATTDATAVAVGDVVGTIHFA